MQLTWPAYCRIQVEQRQDRVKRAEDELRRATEALHRVQQVGEELPYWSIGAERMHLRNADESFSVFVYLRDFIGPGFWQLADDLSGRFASPSDARREMERRLGLPVCEERQETEEAAND